MQTVIASANSSCPPPSTKPSVCTGWKNPLSMLWFVPTTRITQIPRGAIGVRAAPFLLCTQPRPACLASWTSQSNRKTPLSRGDKNISQSSCPTPDTTQTTLSSSEDMNPFFTLPPPPLRSSSRSRPGMYTKRGESIHREVP